MTVYAVSQEYLDEMNEPFILPAFAEAELLNLDAAAQAQVSISTYTGALTGCQTGNIVKVSAEHVDNFATLEPDRMTADGSYGFVPPFYVSSALSASSQDSNGGYAISNVSVTLSFAEGLYIACPLTLVIPAAARISVEISYGYIGNIRTFSKTYDVDADTVTLTDLPDQELYRSVKITVSADTAYPQGVFWDDSGAGKRRYTQSSLHRYQRRHDAGTPAAQGHPCSQQRRREI